MKALKSIEEKNPFELIEEAFYLLRRAPASALAAYYLGGVPFVLGLLFFWSDMARSAFAAERLWPGSVALAAAFIWMKTWQAVFARHLEACLCGEEPPAWRGRWLLRVAVFQSFLQPWGLFLLPLCLTVMIPFGWAYAFFSNLTVLSGTPNPTMRSLCQRAWRQAVLWPMLTHNILFTLTLFCLAVFANLYSAVIGLPLLLDRLLGIESVFSRAPWAAMNSTVTAAVAGLTYLCCDPFLKAAFTLRCFYGESLRTGQDLKAELRRCAAATERWPEPGARGPEFQRGSPNRPRAGHAAAARVVVTVSLLFSSLALPGPGLAAAAEAPELEAPSQGQRASPAAVPPRALQGSIDHVIQQREYSWRLPRQTTRQDKAQTWMEKINQQIVEALKAAGRWFVDLVRWLRNQLSWGTSAGSSTAVAFAMKALVLLLAAALLGFFIWGLWRLWLRREQPVELEVAALPPAPDLADDNVGAEQLPEDGWLQMGRDLLARGDLRLALRAFYLATLAHLAGRNLITLARFKSNQDYERELRRRGHALAAVFERFAENRMVFEQVWYGRHEITQRMLHEFAGNVDRIKSS